MNLTEKDLLAFAGFLSLGLSPSFVDWRQSDNQGRGQIVAYYLIALTLLYFGIIRR